MRKFSFFFMLLGALFFAACESSTTQSKQNRCPKCNMSVNESDPYSAKLQDNSNTFLFDDIGCLVLWARDNNIDLNRNRVEVFTNDTKRYIDAKEAHFGISDKTPMSYGFGAYENDKEATIKVDEVIMKMLRGEHLANPKIRKQILGN